MTFSFLTKRAASDGCSFFRDAGLATRDNILRRGQFSRRFELRIIPCQLRLANKFNQTEADARKLAEQQMRIDAVLIGRPVDVDHDHLPAGAQRRAQP